ncbi:hydrolase [Paraglaciecola aquimarina]|uniref:Hydrolase n=1 Tax=Paraglaciecola aquimarina TaxID=1235557 RepID=A0ABU3ST98_9ALTE|nr:hydrolase [Paraglaciecola aquimarina]MDU0353236.1 hydrolase [Paraglaciecola aquimarina]
MPTENQVLPKIRYGEIVTSDFVPPWWAKNRHVQTIYPRFMQKRAALNYRKEKLILPDGDFVDLVWAGDVKQSRGLITLFHGLEGSIRSHYSNDMAANLVSQGYAVVLMHFRGCGGEVNLKTRAYHSGETEDAWYFLNWLEQKFPETRKVAMGFSLGANMLLKLLSEQPKQKILKAAMAISVPFKLDLCSTSINHGFSRVYQTYLLKSMVQNLLKKMRFIDYKNLLTVTESDIKKFKSFKEFDQHVTAPLHGYASATDYYQQCSSINFLADIDTPTLVLHAKDDPFMHESILPEEKDLSAKVALEVSEKGGHVGFMQGAPWRPKIWMHQRANEFLRPFFTGPTDIVSVNKA